MHEPILITGASGFVGSHVVARAEERGLRTVAFSGDLRDAGAIRDSMAAHRPAGIVHLASARRHESPGRWSVLGDELTMLGNLLSATADMVPSSPVLVAGSASQYGLAGPDPLPETAPTIPITDYGAVKCVLERAALLAPLAKGVRVIWARSFNLLGPGQGLDAPVPNWASQIAQAEHRAAHAERQPAHAERQPAHAERRPAHAERHGPSRLSTGDLEVVRDFLDVRDVGDAYLALLDSDARGPVNVGSGSGVSLREVVGTLLESANVRIEVERDPSLDRPEDPACVVADTTLLRKLTGWQPTIGLRESLTDVLAEWRERVARSETVQCAQ